jgi:hypothetical protein
LTLKPWQQLLQQAGHAQQLQAAHLVLLQQSAILPVIGKFEQLQFVHVYASGTDRPAGCPYSATSASSTTDSIAQASWQLRFELPRFSLEFELQQDGRLLSRDHSGFKLSSCQQLVWGEGLSSSTSSGSRSKLVIDRSSSSGSDDSVDTEYDGAGGVSLAAGRSGSIGSANSMSTGSSSSSSGGGLTGAADADSAADVCYTLPDFQHYLVLERAPCAGSSSTSSSGIERLVLVPAGPVVRAGDGAKPKVLLSSAARSHIQVRLPHNFKLQGHISNPVMLCCSCCNNFFNGRNL